ncbi:MAG: RIP metalloprotease RseP [Deltaproteobacteria bacterium]|nr:MAG: RIP metalloprotease RseP [Deltaproteobacteria bacterium]
MTTSITTLVVVLGVLIFFHELGHFLVARLFGVGVEKFSLGFGPRIYGKTVGITDYRLSAIPLGGYVKMVGDEPDAEIAPELISYAFTHKPLWQRMLIVAAGPFFNWLLAAVIFFGLFATLGTYQLEPVVGSLQPGMPAEAAGIAFGDRILAVNGRDVSTWQEMSALIQHSAGKPVAIHVRRGAETLNLTLKPRITADTNLFGETVNRYLIGIGSDTSAVVQVPVGVFAAMVKGVVQTWEITRLTVLSVVKIIQGVVSPKTLGGPIMIAQMAGEQAKEGMVNLLGFIAAISINLAILNLLPIPVLDGGHLFFFSMEAILRRPVGKRTREIAQQVGVSLLLLLMVWVFFNDIMRMLSGPAGP